MNVMAPSTGWFNVLALSFMFISCCSSTRLSVPRVLLPYKIDVSSNYTLELVEISGGGCYQWSSSRTDIVTLTSVPSKDSVLCPTKVIVSAVSHHPVRHTAIVTAENPSTGEIFRCDVIVDKLHSIKIITTTQELFLEDAPEMIEVTAENDLGDTFSSLNGVQFEWTIVSESSSESQGAVRFIRFSDSTYNTPWTVQHWENLGLQGHAILVEGIKTGTAKISVRPAASNYQGIESRLVTVVVIANIHINPPTVFLLEKSTIRYKVQLIKQGRATEIAMPSNQYYLEVGDSSIAQLNSETSVVTAETLGHTTLLLNDKNIVSRELARRPQAEIYVVKPSYLLFSVSPGENWALLENTEYVITITLYDERHHRVYLSENLVLDVIFPKEHFEVLHSSKNKTYNVIRTLGRGSTKIDASLVGFESRTGFIEKSSYTIKGHQDVVIYRHIEVNPKIMLFPWDPVIKPSYTIYPKATGGTSFYRWAVTNSTVAKVTYKSEDQSSVANVVTNTIGETNVIATDIYNSFFTSQALVSVQPVADIEIVPDLLETELLSDILLPVALYGYEDFETKSKRRVFDDCSKIPLTIEIVDKAKFVYTEDASVPPVGRGCKTLQFTCKAVGHTRIYVSYISGDLNLRTTTVIGCHKPLKPVHPVKTVVIAYGSLKEVAFEGGPRPWPMHQEGHYAKLKAENSSLVSIMRLMDPFRHNRDLHVFRLLCKDLGETNLELNVGNNASATNPNPAKTSAYIRFVCGVPDTVHLNVKVKGPKNPKAPCPVTGEAQKIPVQNYRDIEIEVIVKDALGRKFANITSLDIQWELSDYTLAQPESHRDVITDVDGSLGYRKVSRDYQILHPRNKSGPLKVTAKIVGHSKSVLRQEGLSVLHPLDPAVRQTIELEFVNDAKVDPPKVSVFNHPSHEAVVKVLEGSKYFFLESSDSAKADIKHDENSDEVKIQPRKDGTLMITVHDLCLEVQDVATIQVQIVGISNIRAKVIDKVELHKDVMATVEVIDTNQEVLPASIFNLINLRPVTGSNIISVKSQPALPVDERRAFFTVHGVQLGTTTLQFATGASSDDDGVAKDAFPSGITHSNVISMQVFAPLRLSPRNITLIVGATFQVIPTGGPQPQSNIEFAVKMQNVANVSSAGVITATEIGETILTAQAVGYDSVSKQNTLYSKDEIKVNVVSLHGIKIKPALTRILEHSQIPVYAFGVSEFENPYAFCSAEPVFHYQWSVSNPEVFHFGTLFGESGLQSTQENQCTIRLVARQPGRGTLKLQVRPLEQGSGSTVQIHQNAYLSHEVEIQVFPRLQLLKPNEGSLSVLMTPNSHLALKTNRDGEATVRHKIVEPGNNLVELDQHGVLKAGSKTGRTIITITAQEEFGVAQELTALVEVLPVSFLMINFDLPIRASPYPLLTYPIGLQAKAHVSFHDNIGRKFHAVHSQLRFRASRTDLLQVSQGGENETLIIRATSPGHTILKVWDARNPFLHDYVNVITGYPIYPAVSQLVVGDVVCFTTPLISQEGRKGVWSNIGRALSVSPNSGAAVAVSSGKDAVNYNISTHLYAAFQVHVHSLKKADLVADKITHLSNLKETILYIPVILGNQRTNLHVFSGQSCDIDETLVEPPFHCHLAFVDPSADISALDVFSVAAVFDAITGQYYCAVRPENNAPIRQVSSLNAHLHLSVLLNNEVVDEVILPFLPTFFIHEDELVLSNMNPVGKVEVTMTSNVSTHVLTSSSDANLIEVLPPQKHDNWPNMYVFVIRVHDENIFWKYDFRTTVINVTFECTATRQKETVVVKITLAGVHSSAGPGTCPSGDGAKAGWTSVFRDLWNKYFYWLLVVLIGITTAVLFSRQLAGQKYTVSRQNNVFLSSTPPSHSPAGNLPYSPWRHSPIEPSRLWSTSNTSWSVDRSRTQPS